MKTKNEITLIITIIVMLILVGVTVTVAVNGGIFEKSKEAVDGTITEKKTIPEGTKLADMYCAIEGCTDETHLHKGDYVDYKPATAQAYTPDKGEGRGKYTGYTEGDSEQSILQENLNWRVLGQDDKGNILLISGTPTKTGLGFKGYVAYNNYETVLNDTCKALYSNTELGATARSITMNDIDKYLGGSKYDKTTFNGGSSEPGGYGYQNENAMTSKFKYDKKTNTLTKEDCTIPAKDLTSSTYMYVATSNRIGAKNREILLGKEEEKTYYNWVASRAVYVNGYFVNWCVDCISSGYVYGFGCNFCSSGGGEDGGSLCVRPVVSLPSSVTIEQVSKKDEKVTETWNDPLNRY